MDGACRIVVPQRWLSSCALQEEAGLRTWTDVVGNVHGRVEARWLVSRWPLDCA